MAIADPQQITINAVVKELLKLGNDATSSTYRLDDGSDIWGLEFSHSTSKGRVRHLVKLNRARTAADIYQPATNTIHKMSAHLVVDVPVVGFTTAQQFHVVDSLCEKVRAASGAIAYKLINGEV